MREEWRSVQSFLRTKLGLTLPGRVVASALLSLGLLTALTGTGFAFYNITYGHDPDQVLGLQIAFSWIVSGLLTTVLLAVVIALDFGLRRLATRPA
jgi:hypothetical protein